MEDTFRLDLADYDKPYIEEVLRAFVEDASGYGRRVVVIRIRELMSKKLGIAAGAAAGSLLGVPVEIADTGFDDTIEIVLGPDP